MRRGFGRPTFGGAAPFNVVDFFPSFDVALIRGEVGFASHHGLPGSSGCLVRTPHFLGGWASARAAHPLPERRRLFLPTLLLQPQDVPFAALLPLEQEVLFLLELEEHFFRRS